MIYAAERLTPPPAPAARSAPPRQAQQIEIGDVLNGIYRVTRRIGRGGMSEVFEAVNIRHEGDHVAIKVMLPALAHDAKIRAMFQRETMALVSLTRITDPALVQYRLIAEEPTLGLPYLVMELIDGASLAASLSTLRPGLDDLRGVLRRLAHGLKAAHDMGVVHRDIAPDNIMLQGNRLDQAKIIDFGIVKHLEPGSASIVGDGFAGKLGYVAPEQIGDFDRQVGPWTDVYSLGLVMTSLALGRDVDMGATLFDAVERRRSGPDLSPVPAELQPLIRAMVTQNPAERLRDMGQVLAALDRVDVAPAAPAEVAPRPGPASAVTRKAAPPTRVLVAGAGAILLILAGAVWLVGPHRQSAPPPAPAAAPAAAPPVATAAPTSPDVAVTAATAALSQIPCSWLSVAPADTGQGALRLTLSGVAGSASQAQAAVTQAAASAGAGPVAVDASAASPLAGSLCDVVDAFRPFRHDAQQLTTTATTYTLAAQSGGRMVARPTIRIRLADPAADVAVFGVDSDGVSEIVPSRDALARFRTPDTSASEYLMTPDTDQPGLSGILLLTGRGPFDGVNWHGGATPAATWIGSVGSAAAQGGWKSEMVWFRVVPPGAAP